MRGTCAYCGSEFTSSRPDARYCSRACSHSNAPEDLWRWVVVGAEDDCWPWTRWLDRDGYGKIVVVGRAFKPHRLAFQLATGRDPGDQLVCHSCDNPPCCNPAHLFLGTQADNLRDMRTKGRDRRGSTHPHARLTEQRVREIRRRRAAGEHGRRLAAEFGVSEASVCDAYRGRTWGHVA